MKLQAFSFAPMNANTSSPLQTLSNKAKSVDSNPTATLTADVFQLTAPATPQARAGHIADKEAFGLFCGYINHGIDHRTGLALKKLKNSNILTPIFDTSLKTLYMLGAQLFDEEDQFRQKGRQELAELCADFHAFQLPTDGLKGIYTDLQNPTWAQVSKDLANSTSQESLVAKKLVTETIIDSPLLQSTLMVTNLIKKTKTSNKIGDSESMEQCKLGLQALIEPETLEALFGKSLDKENDIEHYKRIITPYLGGISDYLSSIYQ
jgi:hypothetical protein